MHIRYVPAFVSAMAAGALAAGPQAAAQQPYGFITRLGADTLSIESVTPTPTGYRADLVERNPRVVRSQYTVERDAGGSIRRFEHVRTAANPPNSGPVRTLIECVNGGAAQGSSYRIKLYRRDSLLFEADTLIHSPLLAVIYGAATEAALAELRRRGGDSLTFATITSGSPRFGSIVLRRVNASHYTIPLGYLFKYHATLDSDGRLTGISGRETTLKFELERVGRLPVRDSVGAVFAAWSALEARNGVARELSARDSVVAGVGGLTVSVNYGRPLARGRTILGGVVPYDSVWRTGANAATHLVISSPVVLAGQPLDPGTYTLWTIPKHDGATLIVSSLQRVWGTAYDPQRDVLRVPMQAAPQSDLPERLTISLDTVSAESFSLSIRWGNLSWRVPIESCAPGPKRPAACK